jgi:hypothetical protein
VERLVVDAETADVDVNNQTETLCGPVARRIADKPLSLTNHTAAANACTTWRCLKYVKMGS